MRTIISDNRPDAYAYAVLSQQAYRADLEDGADLETLSNWTVKKVRKGQRGFQAVVFENTNVKQWVVSFKGTDSVSTLLEEVMKVVLKGTAPHMEEAFKLVKELVKGFAVDLILPSEYQLSFTGHSLGGFLAILSLYFAHTLKADWSSLHAVVFECPGARESFKKLKSRLRKIDVGLLDVMSYVSYPNIVNTFDSHYGDSLYAVPTDLGTYGDWSGWYTKKAHSIDGFVEFFRPGREFISADDRLRCLADWPVNGASIVGGEKGYYFSQATFNKYEWRYVLPEESSLIQGTPEEMKVLYQKSKALLFDGHYHEMNDFHPDSCLRLRHFNPGLRQFLSTFHAMSGLLLADEALKHQSRQHARALNIPDDIVEKLLGYQLTRDVDGQWAVILPEGSESVYAFRRGLSQWLSQGGQAQISQWLQQATHASDNRIKVVAELIAKGAQVDGVVISNTVEGLSIYLPEGATEDELQQAQQLMSHLKTVVKEVRAYLVAEGGNVSEKAILWNNTVVGAATHVGKQKQPADEENTPNIAHLLAKQTRYKGVAGTASSSSTHDPGSTSSSAGDDSVKVTSGQGEFSNVNHTFLTSSHHISSKEKSLIQEESAAVHVSASLVSGGLVSGNIHDNTVIGHVEGNVYVNKTYTMTIPPEAKVRGDCLRTTPDLFYEADTYGMMPVSNPHFVGRVDIFNALKEAFSQSQGSAAVIHEKRAHRQKLSSSLNPQPLLPQAVGIVGAGGMGKTQLAAEYVYTLMDEAEDAPDTLPVDRPYALKVWLRGERTHLEEDLRRLACWLGFEIAFDPKTPIKDIVPTLYERLARLSTLPGRPLRARVLFVIDDGQWDESLLELLPQPASKYLGTFRWLITSREHTPWHHYFKNHTFKPLRLDVFTKEEALAYFERIFHESDIQNDTDYTIQNLTVLAELLGYLPLALTQAAAYIKQATDINKIEQYIQLFKTQWARLVKRKIEDPDIPEYEHTILTTWLISLPKINAYSAKTIELLEACAYLDGFAIPQELLVDYRLVAGYGKDKTAYNQSRIDAARLDTDEQLSVLENYSFLIRNRIHGQFTLHSLLQKVLRGWMQGAFADIEIAQTADIGRDLLEGHHSKILPQITQALINHSQKREPSMAEIRRRIALLTQFEAIMPNWEEAYPNEVGNFSWEGELFLSFAKFLFQYGFILVEKGDTKMAKVYFELCLQKCEARFGKDHIALVEIVINLANVYRIEGAYNQAKIFYERALMLLEAQYEKNCDKVAEVVNNLGVIYLNEGNYGQAEIYFGRTLKLKEALYGKDHITLAEVMNNLGEIYRIKGNYVQAKDYLERALKLLNMHYGEDHITVADSMNNLGKIYHIERNYARAKNYCERALKSLETHYGENHFAVSDTLINLGHIYYDEGHYPQAKRYFQRALKLLETQFGENHIAVSDAVKLLGMVHLKEGNYDQAESCFKRTLKLQKTYYGKNHISTAGTRMNLGIVYHIKGNYIQAKNYLERAHQLKEAHYGKDHPEVKIVLRVLQSVPQEKKSSCTIS